MAKPSIIVNGGTPGAMTSVSASTAWTATLDSIDGVRQVEWAITSTDETTTAGSYTLVQSGSVGQTVASTSQGQGTGVILWVRVNNGLVGDQPDPTNTEATIKIVVPLPDGGIVGCAGEEYESDSTFGATGIINQGIRKAALLSPSGVPVKIVRAATAAALPANTRTANVLTADINGAIGTVGGVAVTDGDYILVQNEGGGASHVNNGVYVLADGDGSNPWTLTRATYFDDSAELIAMTTFRIQEGTYAGKERYLVTSGATINVTALEFAAFGYAPNDAAYLTVGAVSDLSAERNISAVTSTLSFESTTVAPIGAKRTDSATAALVDVAEATALSSGTAAAGFGPSVKFLGEVSGGGAENYGRVGFAATDLTGGSEDTKFVMQARTAGAALATVAEFSGTAVSLPGIATGVAGILAIDGTGGVTRTASAAGLDANAHVLEDATTALGANGVPMRAAPSTVGFVGVACAPISLTHKVAAAASVVEGLRVSQRINAGSPGTGGEGVRIALSIPDNAGVDTIGASWRTESTSILLSVNSKAVWATVNAGALTDWMTLSSTGILSVVTGLQSPSLDAIAAAALTLGATNATSLVIDTTTGVITKKKGGTTACTETWDPAGASSIVPVAGSTSFTIQQAQLGGNGATAGNTTTIAAQKGQNVAAGPNNAGGDLILASGDHGSGGVDGQPGDVLIKIGTANAINIAGDGSTTDFGATTVTGTTFQASSKFVGPQIDRATSGVLTLGGTNATSIAASSLKITGLANGSSASDAAAFGQIGTAVNAAVSGTTNTLAKFTGTNVVGDSSITDASGTVDTTSVVTVTKAGIGTTKTAGLYSINTTASGSQVSAQIGGSAKHSGGTQHNFGWQCEPQTAGRAIWRLCYGTGDPVSSPPASTGMYVDTSEPTYGVTAVSSAFMSNGGVGFRMSVNGGGIKENGGTGQINFYSASTSIGALFECAIATGDSDPAYDFYCSAGTRTAGNFAQIRDGGGTVFAVSSATATRGRVSINGIPIGWNIVTTNANATVAIGDRVHVQGGGITITLPAVPSVVSTRDHDIIIMEVNGAALGSPITINAAAGDLINGASSATINVPNGAMTLCHDGDGTNWRIVSSHLL